MQKLTQILEVKGTGIPNLTATLIERTDTKAVYMRSDDVYEVFKVKVSPEEMINGYSYPEREVYPCNEDFGSTAWTFTNRQRALDKYNKI